MARSNKTFRPTELIAEKLKERAKKEGKSESDLINMALSCFLGLNLEDNCQTLNEQIKTIQKQINSLIRLNNLKTEP